MPKVQRDFEDGLATSSKLPGFDAKSVLNRTRKGCVS